MANNPNHFYRPLHQAALAAAAMALNAAGASEATSSPSLLQSVQVTATRFGDPIQEVPDAIAAVTGDDLRARGATDLRSALASLGSVSVAPGGDAGPAGAVPGLLGVREIDDLLLLIDGIPAGGAFLPQAEAVSLNNVERIEVLRGAAPVYFGTTAFAGTINVIHYPAGRADSSLNVHFGSYGSMGVSGAQVLSTGAVRQSVSAEWNDTKLSDARAGYKRAQGGWRLDGQLGAGSARVDLNLLALRQKPTSPTAVDPATGKLTTLLPEDFNANPADARLDTDRYQIVLGYELPLSFGSWGNTLSTTWTRSDMTRGFIDLADSRPPWTAATNADLEAYKQTQHLRELFFDSHLTRAFGPTLDMTGGVNLLLGRAEAGSVRYGLRLLLDGVSQTPATDTVAPKGTVDLGDSRRFLGLYTQSRFKLTPEATVLAGLRWNSTHESRDLTSVNRRGVVSGTTADQDVDRLTGSVGAQWKAWKPAAGPIDGVTLHASVGSTFQPAAIEFGPESETPPEGGGLLKPETERSFVFGARTRTKDGRFEVDLDGFIVDFDNQPVQARSSSGAAVLRSIGKQRFKGIDLEGAMHPAPSWTLRANIGRNDARYRDFVTEIDGVRTQLAGRHQVLTPNWRAGAGVVYAPTLGWNFSLTTNWTGRHWLNSANTFAAPSYAIIDSSLGYRFKNFSLQVAATNLGDRRDAVQTSELGEGQFYRMAGRRFDFSVSIPFQFR